jgi:hypothetical protein
MESIIKHKKIFHKIRSNEGEQEANIREEKTLDLDGGIIIEERTESKRCTCGREIIIGKDKTYVCQSCKKELCEDCFYVCIGGDIVCVDCMGVYQGQPVCPLHWCTYDIFKLYREAKEEEEKKKKEEERNASGED